MPNLVLRTLYVRNIGLNVAFWIDMRHSFIKCYLISYMYFQTSLKHGLAHFISISYVLAKSSALVIQLVNPCSCKRFKWLYTCLTNCESGIWCNRLKLNNDTWHDKLWGKYPHSPHSARFDVVALTLNTQRIYRKKTRSNSCIPDLKAPHTSLPYVGIVFTRESNI